MQNFFTSNAKNKHGQSVDVVTNYQKDLGSIVFNIEEIKRNFNALYNKYSKSKYNPLPMNATQLFVHRFKTLLDHVLQEVRTKAQYFEKNSKSLATQYSEGRGVLASASLKYASEISIPALKLDSVQTQAFANRMHSGL